MDFIFVMVAAVLGMVACYLLAKLMDVCNRNKEWYKNIKVDDED